MILKNKMLLGVVIGMCYALWGFGGVGDTPTLCITWGPFHNGILWVGGYHIHHWMVCGLVMVCGLLMQWAELTGFCAVMVAHGLAYEDAFSLTGCPDGCTAGDAHRSCQ
jgi:hypothetical protein